MSKKETKAARRETARHARVEAQRKRQRARRRRQVLTWSAVGIVLAAVAGFVIYRNVEGRVNVGAAAREAGCSQTEEFPEQGRNHIPLEEEHEPYNSNPPTSGPHFASPADWGVYRDRIEPEVLVHNLEHGGIVIHYKDLEEDQIEVLEDLVESFGDGVILVPADDIDHPLALSAWQNLRTCQRPSEDVIRGFVGRFCGKGPERIPLSC